MMRTAGRTLLGRTAVLAVSLPLAGGVLLAAAPAASAAVTSPGNGTVFTSYSTIGIRADFGPSGAENTLDLTSPGGPAVTVARAPADRINGGTLSYSLDTGCWVYPSSSCTGRKLAPNGTWTVTQSGGGSGSVTFVTRIRPEAPTSVSASAVSSREARVSWRMGAEPDLVGWTVFEGGSPVKDGVGKGSCSGTTCSTVITYATDGSGEHTYTVRAFRSVAPGSTSTLESPMSSAASVRLESPPPAPPPAEPSPTSGGTSGGGTGSDPSSGSGSDPSGGTGSTGTGSSPSSGGSSPSAGSAGSGGSGGTGSGGTDGGSSEGGSSGSSGGSTSPIRTSTGAPETTASERAVAQRKAFALGFTAFGPKLGIPKLPPLPQAQAPAVAPELADGTYEPTLGFEDQIVRERVETSASAPTERARSVVGSALDSERLLRSSAAALVLLLAGAHLRRWLASTHSEH